MSNETEIGDVDYDPSVHCKFAQNMKHKTL